MVLASDAHHSNEELERSLPFAVAHSMAGMMQAHDHMVALAETAANIVPGHDPMAMRRYPAPRPELEGSVVRLDVDPA